MFSLSGLRTKGFAMKRFAFACLFMVLTSLAAQGEDLYWDFETPGPNELPSDWSGNSWYVGQGVLRNVHPEVGFQFGEVRTPLFRFVSDPSSVSDLSQNDGGDSGIANGASIPSTVISIANFQCSPHGNLANCLVELVRVDQDWTRVATLSTGPFNGPIMKSYTEPVIEAEGIYSVRFRTTDNNDPDTGASASDLRITNAVLLIPGDYNGDGTVDAADYVVWRNWSVTISTSPYYQIWRAHFGQSGASGSVLVSTSNVSVPEPTSTLLLILGASLAGWSGCRNALRMPTTC
jgi:hypothetical protein